MFFDYYLFLNFFLSGIMVFFLNFKFLLINLLSLEFMMLCMFFCLYLFLINLNYDLFYSMIFLTFMVCEGVLGLSLLISMVRVLGNNYMNFLNLIKC